MIHQAGEGAGQRCQALPRRQGHHRRREGHQGAVRERRGEQLRGQQQQVLQVQLLQGGCAGRRAAHGVGDAGEELRVHGGGVAVVDEAEEGGAYEHPRQHGLALQQLPAQSTNTTSMSRCTGNHLCCWFAFGDTTDTLMCVCVCACVCTQACMRECMNVCACVNIGGGGWGGEGGNV